MAGMVAPLPRPGAYEGQEVFEQLQLGELDRLVPREVPARALVLQPHESLLTRLGEAEGADLGARGCPREELRHLDDRAADAKRRGGCGAGRSRIVILPRRCAEVGPG